MKIIPHPTRSAAGILLVECIVYLAVFTIVTGIATAAFYQCWNQSRAVVCATDDIGAALRAGERWRADIRNATGNIQTEPAGAGQELRIPLKDNTVVYRFEAGQIRREIPATQRSDVLLQTVNKSKMISDQRGGVSAWRWELDLAVRRPETQLPLLFTFEAPQAKP